MDDARVAAARVLVALERGRTTLSSELEKARPAATDPRDQALFVELSLGATRWLTELDARLRPHLQRPADSIAPEVRAILRLAAYQLFHLSRIPPHAVVHESVEATRRMGHPRASGFVNAVLRNLLRQRAANPLPSRPDPTGARTEQMAYLTTSLAHPEWLAARWLDRLGFEACERWCQFNNAGGTVTVRPLDGDAATLLEQLRGEGIEAQPARWVRDAIQLPPGSLGKMTPGVVFAQPPGKRLPESFSRSRFIVQDEGAQLVALAVGAQAGERVLDVCAAPGGKTVLLARLVGPDGTVVAGDHRRRRVALLAETIRRTNARAHVLALNAEQALPFRPVFDRVLLDVPCSGLGVLRRDPDIKWSRSEGDLQGFAAAQGRMIRAAADVVKPGGTLIYATCSSEPEENEHVVDAFLRERTDFALERVALPAGSLAAPQSTDGLVDLLSLVNARGFLATRPDTHQLDAYFAARLVRRNAA